VAGAEHERAGDQEQSLRAGRDAEGVGPRVIHAPCAGKSRRTRAPIASRMLATMYMPKTSRITWSSGPSPAGSAVNVAIHSPVSATTSPAGMSRRPASLCQLRRPRRSAGRNWNAPATLKIVAATMCSTTGGGEVVNRVASGTSSGPPLSW